VRSNPLPPASTAVLTTSAARANYITEDELKSGLAQLQSSINWQLYNSTTTNAYGGLLNEIAATNRINNLSNVTISGATVSGGISGLSASDIPTNVVAANYLPLAGGTLTGALADTATASSSFAGALGIGTTSPSDLFALNGPIYLADVTPAATTNRLYSNAGSLYWAGSLIGGASSGNWTSDGTNVWRTGGNLGIGTSSPFATLSVAGNGFFTGTLSGQVLDHGGGSYNVKAYGAKGDGITDDTSVIQAALNAAYSAGGGIVYIPPTGHEVPVDDNQAT
jgi:hypothetical protein